MEFFGAMVAFGIVVQVVVLGLLTVAFPVFWIWMLVDSVLRAEHEYPGGGANDKVVWVLFIALVQVIAVFYFFMVYRKVRRGPAPPSPVYGAVVTQAGAGTPAA